MSVHFEQDKPIFVPFREGKSIFNSQGVPRIYKSVEAFRRWFPGHYLGDDGITLVEYAPVVRCLSCAFNDVCRETGEYKGMHGFCSKGKLPEPPKEG